MTDPNIKTSTLDFLYQLSSNNNREWFKAHKRAYEAAKENAEHFLEDLLETMNQHDQLDTPSGKKSLYRIYNDVRFSQDKSPYNPRFAAYLKRAKPLLRGGYYLWIKPGGSLIGCGFAAPNAADLKRIREDMVVNQQDWNQLLASKDIQDNFGAMKGTRVKTVPRGFSSNEPAIDLIRYRQYWFEHAFKDGEVTAPDFLRKVNETFKAIRPLFDYMTEVLTTDANGEPLYEKPA